MENLGALIYWITRLDSLVNFMVGVFIVGSTASIVWIMFGIMCRVDSYTDDIILWKKNVWIPIFTLVILFVGIFIPTSKEMALIYIAPKIVNSEFAKELPSDLRVIKDLGMEKIKEMLATKKETK